MYVGSTITVAARQLKIVEYGDNYTKNALEFTQAVAKNHTKNQEIRI